MRPMGALQLLSDAPTGGILVLTNEGVKQIINNEVREFYIPALRRAFHLNCVLSDRDGALWFGTADGGLIHVHDGRADVFGIADGLSGEHVDSLFEDREGSVWAAGLDGLDGFHALPATTYSAKQGVSGGGGAILADEDGGVWFSGLTGLYRWRDGHITVHRVRPEPRRVSPPSSGGVDELALAELPETPVGSLFQDRLGRIWLGAQKSLGYVENKRFVTVVGVPGGYIDSLTEDKEGNLWIAHREAGLLRLSAHLKMQQFPWTMISGSDAARAWRLATDPVGGGLWIGSAAGGIVYFMGGQVKASFGVGDGLGKGSVNDLRAATDGTVWAATDGGLSRLKAGRIATLDSRSGLPCDAVDSSIDDGTGSTWLYTHCGLVRIASRDLDAQAAALELRKVPEGKVRMTVLDDSDGIPSFGLASSYSPHLVKSKDGKLWLTTRDGVAVVDPQHLHFNEVRPPVHVEQVIADGHTYDASSRLKLPPLPRDLEIKYTALSLAAPGRVQFRYKLEGRDRDWRNAGNGRGASYSDLAPGNYRFHVIASNNSGVWNEQGDTLDFSIAPAYWQTIWFKTLCVLAFLGLLWVLYQLRLRQVTRQFELGLEARVAERTRIARELHDTLLQGFHGVLLRFQTAARLLPTRPAEARQVLETTLDQAEQALADGRNAVQGLRSSVVEAPELADAIKTLGEELAADPARDRFIPLSLRVEGTPRKLRAIVRDEIYRIASEALRNAFRHSGATRIEVELQYDERHFELRVRDDGKGIDAKFLSEEGRGKHFGLSGMRERAEMIGGKLALWTSPNSGTELELKIPALRAYRASPRRRSWLLERFSTVGGEREP
jgi:signal transduction histidine kinase/ligand-binding sensor domain-containing protein